MSNLYKSYVDEQRRIDQLFTNRNKAEKELEAALSDIDFNKKETAKFDRYWASQWESSIPELWALINHPNEAGKDSTHHRRIINIKSRAEKAAQAIQDINNEIAQIRNNQKKAETARINEETSRNLAVKAEQQRLQDEFDAKTRERLQEKYIPQEEPLQSPAPEGDEILEATEEPKVQTDRPSDYDIRTPKPTQKREYVRLPFTPIDNTTRVIAGIINDYNALEDSLEDALTKSDILSADKILTQKDAMKPHLNPLIELGNKYTIAFEEKNVNEVKVLEDQIYKLSGDVLQSKPYKLPPVAPLNVVHANTITNSMSTSTSPVAGIGEFTEHGHEKWRSQALANALNTYEKSSEQNGVYPKSRPIVGPSNIRRIADRMTLMNMGKKDISGNFNNVRTNLNSFVDKTGDNEKLYSNLRNSAMADPFSPLQATTTAKTAQTTNEAPIYAPNAEDLQSRNVNRLSEAANRAKQAVSGHLQADEVGDEILSGNVSPEERTVLEKYLNPFRKLVVNDAISDLDKDYNERIKPMIAHEISSHPGLRSSGYRNVLLDKAERDLAERKRKTRNELGYKGYETAVEHAQKDREIGLQGYKDIGSQRMSALEHMAELPQKEALAENINTNTITKIAGEREALDQAAENAKYDKDVEIQQAPVNRAATMANIISGLQPVNSYTAKSTAPVGPNTSPRDMTEQWVMMNAMKGMAEGGQVDSNDDYYKKLDEVMNYYRHKEKPNAMKEMVLDSIANMYSGKSKYVSDNIAASMPQLLQNMRNTENSYMDNDLKALEIEGAKRKAMAEEEDRRLKREDAMFERGIKNQYLDIERQKLGNGPVMTPQQRMLNNKIIKETKDEAKAASSVLPKIKSLYNAFDQFDNNASRFTQAGDLTTSGAAKKLGSERLMSDKQRAAAQVITKEKGQLAKLMFSHGLGQALGAKSEDELRAALPDTNLLPEARKQILSGLAKEESVKELRNIFFYKWKAANGGDVTDADLAFGEFMKSANPIDESGFAKSNATKLMDEMLMGAYNDEESSEDESYIMDAYKEARERGLVR